MSSRARVRDPKTVVLRIRVSHTLYSQLRVLALKNGRSVSEVARKILREGIRKCPTKTK